MSDRRSIDEVMVRAAKNAKREEKFDLGFFKFISLAGHILESSCKHSEDQEDPSCLKCKYDRELKLEERPEMVFARNSLTIQFGRLGSIEFNALDALKMVCADRLPDVKVGASTVWQSARQDRIQQISEHQKPFDWTYTTHYKGTVTGCQVTPTTERIDMERLKRRDEILFSSSITLFEDELADHGIAQLLARVRVMRGYFFVLLRFYMRVDNVLLRVCDTRIVGNEFDGHVIREWQLREAKYGNLGHVDPEELLDVDRAWMHLPVVEEHFDRVSVDRERLF
ncbi:TIP41-like protein [Caenorhabditis elegans]|uniref:TIP41-like protein n=1 Tax=Caenorhabditis elegans TaxID=6239 RepID=TIPRL_CAEEL|nr:TIP41-like protein [Caenorhabditis elegans]P34274.3 RecName: Full=TIP41-like protein [Caenorhabditis elegans]CCD62545.1 TIP41-like protein [Caenorhabditis elegans]|eukprot:NP_498713.3 TIP41-like protein [Caenorhabditis elegans]